MFENLISNLVLAGISGTIISGLTVLGGSDNSWAWRKFLYSIGLAIISGLVVIEGFGQPVSESTIIPIFLAIVGGSFVGNKLHEISNKLKTDG